MSEGKEPIHIISLGAGVQSSTMALMAAKGEIGPMPKCAIFADTQAEPKGVYDWLGWLERQLPFPVLRVTAGSLTDISTTPRTSRKSGEIYMPHAVPAFVLNANNTIGQTLRQCTDKHKLAPLRKAILAQGESAIVWIGISTDEVTRMKDSNHSRITHRWPLIDLRMSRRDCMAWMERNGYPKPPRSACSYCPYHSDKEWRRIKDEEPEAFQDAIAYEGKLQAAFTKVPRYTGTPFLHRSCQPLSQVDFSTEEERGQLNMFENECEGMCGV
jgi:hypothetical protein